MIIITNNNLATWCEELTHWKRPWCWVRLKVGGEGDSRGWDGWIASWTQWTWIWVSSRSWWWTGEPGVLQSTGLQGVRHNWATELNWTELIITKATKSKSKKHFPTWSQNCLPPCNRWKQEYPLPCFYSKTSFLTVPGSTSLMIQMRKMAQSRTGMWMNHEHSLPALLVALHVPHTSAYGDIHDVQFQIHYWHIH